MNCPHPRCDTYIVDNQFACPRHYDRLPRPVKDRIEGALWGTMHISWEQLVREARLAWALDDKATRR